MRKLRRHTGLWQYLHSLGILDTEDKAAIAKAKKAYWREYDRKAKAAKRKQKRIYSVSFRSTEIKLLINTARAKGMSVPDYIRAATYADMNSTYVVPYIHLLREIEQLLHFYKRLINELKDKDNRNWLGVSRSYDKLEKVIVEMEREVRRRFTEAIPVEMLVKNALHVNPAFASILSKTLEEHGRKIPDA